MPFFLHVTTRGNYFTILSSMCVGSKEWEESDKLSERKEREKEMSELGKMRKEGEEG